MSTYFDRIDARGLVKVYGATRALAGVDATFSEGEVTVVEGPNGSGKSTLLSILAQVARPTRGAVTCSRSGSSDARADLGPPPRARIGVLAHAAMLYPDLSAKENLHLFAKLYSVANPESKVAEATERFELGTWADRPTRTYSRGQLQRAALARALLHGPKLLLLDEPSTGLDQASVDRLEQVVQAERERGAIVVLVTHDGPFADRVATRRVRLSRGRVVTGDA